MASNLNYTLIKKGVENNNTVLVMGGIQGDEPGGFLAANLIALEYNITAGSVWVIPNLNFDSIIKNNRGAKGDMNRKFATLAKNDPDYRAVMGVKKLVADPAVSLIVHLHDGSGFYREKYINAMENPKRWGNSCIIDQEKLPGSPYGDLIGISSHIAKEINKHIKDPKHKYHVKNTRTAEGDTEMLKSLTWYAVTEGKAAFANEASKSLPTHLRVYYHLLAIESYLRTAGIKFERSFALTPDGVKKAIEKEIDVSINDGKFFLALKDPRKQINFVPMPKGAKLEYNATNPLAALISAKGGVSVYYGNRMLTKITPEYFEYSNLVSKVDIKLDGKDEQVPLGTKIYADKSIEIVSKKGIRVNVIGYSSNLKSETDVNIGKKDIDRKFSIDKAGKLFRVEFYEESKSGAKDKFIGMFLVEFAFLDGEIKAA